MGLKAYYDCSGKSDDPNCHFVTLAGFSAGEDTWTDFEDGWREVLRPYGLDYMHMSEAWALEGPFSKDLGWSRERVSQVFAKLVNFLSRFRDFEHGKTDLMGFSCTVNLDDYRSIAPRHVEPVKDVESMCVDWCAGHQFNRAPEPTPGYLHLYFDRNEDFLHKIKRVWDKKVTGQRSWWAHYVTTIAPVDDMRKVPPMQLADLLAWSQHAKYAPEMTPSKSEWCYVLACFTNTMTGWPCARCVRQWKHEARHGQR